MIILNVMSWQHFTQLQYIRNLPIHEQVKKYNYYLMEQQAMQVAVNNAAAAAGSGGTRSTVSQEPSGPPTMTFDISFDESNYFQFQVGNYNYHTSLPLEFTIDWGDGTVETSTADLGGDNAINHTYANSNNRTVSVSIQDSNERPSLQFNGNELVPGSGIVTDINNLSNFTNLVYFTLLSSSFAGEAGTLSISSDYMQGIIIQSCSAITTISLPNSMPEFFTMLATDNSNLTTITLGSVPIIATINASNCALSETTVDNLLILMDSSTTEYPGTIDFSGGTNSPPSAAGLAVTGSLIAKGFTVLVN